MVSSPSENTNILVFANTRFMPKFERDGYEVLRTGDFGDFSTYNHCISETVQDRTMVAIDH